MSETAVVVMDAGEAKRFLANAVLFASNDQTRPTVLRSVLVSVGETGLRTVSTDSYVLLAQTYAPGVDPQGVDQGVAVLVDVRPIVSALKPRRGDRVRMLVSESGVTVECNGASYSAPSVGAASDFPSWEKLFPPVLGSAERPNVDVFSFGLGAEVTFARLAKLAAPGGTKNLTVRFTPGVDANRPCLAEASDRSGDGVWDARCIIMPVRLT
jgi:hypothetical protein